MFKVVFMAALHHREEVPSCVALLDHVAAIAVVWVAKQWQLIANLLQMLLLEHLVVEKGIVEEPLSLQSVLVFGDEII